MKVMRRTLLCAALMLALLCAAVPTSAESQNPLVTPLIRVEETETPERLKNVLLLGIDYGETGYWGSYGKKDLKDCHTDAVMVISFNQTTGRVNLVSIPRDTVTYVPRVRGVYKFNAAINCAETVEDGILNALDAARWVLGGIEINDYIALDMPAVFALGDAIGGLDMELEMTYTGSSGKKYYKGMQHLDGVGIMDYARARINATVGYNDLGRTNRQRQVVSALIRKLKSQPTLIKQAWNVIGDGEHNIYTSLKLGEVLNLAAAADNEDGGIGVFVLEGKYRSAMRDWNFTFTDQQHRLEVLKEAFGIDAQEIPYVSYDYCAWLTRTGFRTAHALNMAREVMAYAKGLSGLTPGQQAVVDEMNAAYDAAAAAFDRAADEQSDEADGEMTRSVTALRAACEAAAKETQFPGKVSWNGWYYWFTDPYVNEYPDIVWQ